MLLSVSAVLQLVLSWVLLGALFMGIGLWVKGLIAPTSDDLRDGLRAFWLGFALTIAGLQLWHFVAPINALSFVAFAGIGITGIIWQRWLLRPYWAALRAQPLLLIIFGALALFVAMLAFSRPVPYDDGLYHIQNLRWTQQYAIVPGIGNLHSRLAFNDTLILPWAMLDAVSFLPPVRHVGSSLLVVMFAATVLFVPHSIVLRALILPTIVFAVRSNIIAGVKNDLAIFILGFVIGLELYHLLRNADGSHTAQYLSMLTITLLAAAGISIKLSFAVFGALAVLAAVGAVLAHYLALWRRVLLALVIVGVVMGGAWLTRGILLSGYPLYPRTVLAAPVDWRLSEAVAYQEVLNVVSWGRGIGNIDPTYDLSSWAWLLPWFGSHSRNWMGFTLPLLLSVVSASSWVICALQRRKRSATQRRLALWYMPIIGGLIFWFFTAPEPRFGGFLLWLLGLFSLEFVSNRYDLWRVLRPLAYLGVLLLSVYYLRVFSLNFGMEHTLVPDLPMNTFITDDDLLLYTPEFDNRCYDAPLPCTPYPLPNLALRGADLGDGFWLRPQSLD